MANNAMDNLSAWVARAGREAFERADWAYAAAKNLPKNKATGQGWQDWQGSWQGRQWGWHHGSWEANGWASGKWARP